MPCLWAPSASLTLNRPVSGHLGPNLGVIRLSLQAASLMVARGWKPLVRVPVVLCHLEVTPLACMGSWVTSNLQLLTCPQ